MEAESLLRGVIAGVGVNYGVEVIAGVEEIVALKVVGGAVVVVGAGSEADVDDGAGLPAVFGGRIFHGVEFLNGVDGKVRGRSPLYAFGVNHGGGVVGIVVVGAVDDEVVVLGAIAIGADGEEAAAGIALDTGTKGDKVLEIAAVQGKVVNGFVVDGAAESGVGKFEERNFFGDDDGVRDGAGGKIEIQGEVFGDFETDGGVLGDLETLCFDADFVAAGRERGD